MPNSPIAGAMSMHGARMHWVHLLVTCKTWPDCGIALATPTKKKQPVSHVARLLRGLLVLHYIFCVVLQVLQVTHW